MLAAILPVRSLLLAVFALMAGSGVLSTLISIRLERAGTSTLVIGLVATAYFVGLTLGALRAGRMVGRIGHIRAFAAFVSLFSASTLAFLLWQEAPAWALLRLVNGFCAAGVYVCIESWLNERAETATRGAILSGYMISLYLGQAAGQQLLNLTASPALPFVACSILVSLAAIPVLLTDIAAPAPGEGRPHSFWQIYAVSPLGAIGTVLTGMMIGAFYAMAAVSVGRLGLNLAATATFMSTAILGGVALQMPLGRLSDHFDRRRVIVLTFAGTGLCSVALALLEAGGWPLLALGALFGGLSFALYPLCVAHTNDRLEPDQRVAATGGLVLLYSIGAAVGPLGGSAAMTLFGQGGLFAFIALCAAVALMLGVWRQLAASPVPAIDQQAYQVLPCTTPEVAMLDPVVSGEPERDD